MPFTSLNLHAPLLKAIGAAGYEKPSPIQAATIPPALAGRDLIATAQTGTGKTAAFVLPALQRLMDNKPGKGKGPRVLILAPTRELALQVKDAVEKYSKYFERMNIASVLGGMSYHIQNRQLSRPVDVLVATPGRLIDHMEQGNIDFSRLEMLILDEADRMLDMGFFDDVAHIVDATPASRQTLMFSATFDKNIARLAQKLLKNPERIDIAAQQAQHKQIKQSLHYVNSQGQKKQLLLQLFEEQNIAQAIIFTSTKRGADELSDDIKELGYATASLHGDMRQSVRNRTIEQLRRGKIQFLVATDVAARGIDVSSISHVFNFDIPRIAEDYVHRIGRTGRAGSFGTAISIATYKEKNTIRSIERYIKHSIPVQNEQEDKSYAAKSKGAAKHAPSYSDHERPERSRSKRDSAARKERGYSASYSEQERPNRSRSQRAGAGRQERGYSASYSEQERPNRSRPQRAGADRQERDFSAPFSEKERSNRSRPRREGAGRQERSFSAPYSDREPSRVGEQRRKPSSFAKKRASGNSSPANTQFQFKKKRPKRSNFARQEA